MTYPDTDTRSFADGLDIRKLKALVSHMPAAVYRCRGDEVFTLEFFSDEVEKLTGYPVEYFMADRVAGYSRLVAEEDWPLLRTAIREAIDQKHKYAIEYRIHHKSGEIRWVYESGKGVYDEEDKISYVDGCIIDITERKKTEEALLKSENEVRRLALVAHNTTNAVLITDADGYITWINRGYTKLTGYTIEELVDKKIGYSLEGPQPDNDQSTLQRIRMALSLQQPFKEEFMSYTKSGSPVWLQVDCQP